MLSWYDGHQEDLLSDAVFSDDESGYREPYSPYTLSYENASVTSSVHDVYSPRKLTRQDAYSPSVSSYSTYSQEVKYIFDPTFGVQARSRSYSNIKMQSTPVQEGVDPSGNSTEDDYSHIQLPHRRSSVQRKSSNCSQVSYKSKNPPPPPPRTSSSASQPPGEGTLGQRKMGLSHSMSASCYYPQPQHGRRKTWSPDGLHLGYTTTSARRDHRLRSYSNEQLMEPGILATKEMVLNESDAAPPKLTPVSGMLNKVGYPLSSIFLLSHSFLWSTLHVPILAFCRQCFIIFTSACSTGAHAQEHYFLNEFRLNVHLYHQIVKKRIMTLLKTRWPKRI